LPEGHTGIQITKTGHDGQPDNHCEGVLVNLPLFIIEQIIDCYLPAGWDKTKKDSEKELHWDKKWGIR
jgi:hypothetical protein